MSDYFTGSVPSSGSGTPAPSWPPPAPSWPPPAPSYNAPTYNAPTYTAPTYSQPTAAAFVPAQPGYPPAAGAPSWPPYQGGSSMSGGLLALVVVACTFGAVIVIGILAAIAIPVFLDQRGKAEAAATTVSIPEQVAGLRRLHDARSVEMEQQLQNQPGQQAIGVYGVGTSVRVAVAVTKQSMSNKDGRDFLAGAERSFHNQGLGQTAFADVYPGRLGGTMRCSAPTPPISVCIFVDHGVYGTISLFGDMVGRTDTAVAVREAVEHRS